MRLVLAVVTGYLIFAVSAALWFQFGGQDPHAVPSLMFAVGSVAWGIAFAALGGYVAVRGTQRDSLAPGIAVGCVIAAGALVSLVMEGRQDSMWSQLSALLLMAPAACLGGLIKRRKPS
jgi:fructose-specific phosphotransferase system IIC component